MCCQGRCCRLKAPTVLCICFRGFLQTGLGPLYLIFISMSGVHLTARFQLEVSPFARRKVWEVEVIRTLPKHRPSLRSKQQTCTVWTELIFGAENVMIEGRWVLVLPLAGQQCRCCYLPCCACLSGTGTTETLLTPRCPTVTHCSSGTSWQHAWLSSLSLRSVPIHVAEQNKKKILISLWSLHWADLWWQMLRCFLSSFLLRILCFVFSALFSEQSQACDFL